jgi:class 3 adenylate cyclase/pSer/pThr/pTyr-binding forkhead associated (FHA) protein
MVVDPDGSSHDVPLQMGEMTIGRDPGNHIALVGRGVSRKHARLVCTDRHLRVDDLGSRYGTRVNGEQLGGEPGAGGPARAATRVLQVGDVISIGVFSIELKSLDMASTMRVRLVQAEPANARTLVESADGTGLRRAVEQALAHDRLDTDRGGMAVRALELLFRASELLSSTQSVDMLLDRVLDLAIAETGADVAVALLWDESEVESVLSPRAWRAAGGETGEIQVSRTVVERVAFERQAIAADVALDPRLASSRSMAGMGVRAVAATPLMAGDDLFGVLYMHRMTGSFDGAAYEVMAVLGRLIGASIERAHGRALERFHPPEVAAELAKRSGSHVAPAEGRATVLAVELGNFEGLSERTEAPALLKFLSGFYELVHAVVMASGGTLVSFADGRALALYGVPRSQGKDAAQAAQAALLLKDRFEAWVGTHKGLGVRPHLRVALDTGRILATPIGPDAHLTYSAIGAAVTTAKALALRSPDTLLLTDRTFAELDPEAFHVLTVDRAYGSGEVIVYELVSRIEA